VSFEGRVSDAHAAELLSGCQALVVTATEEFGIAAVEAQAAGRPVIALADGGVWETVIEGETGTFYESSDPESLAGRVASFDPAAIDPAACVANSERFDVSRFMRELSDIVAETRAESLGGASARHQQQLFAEAGF
jgi:glycosyltransferase involved in cell wall biosynthesis